MKRLVSVLILLLLAPSTLPHPALASDPATITATAPDGQHTLYSDLHGVELETYATGQRINLDLADIYAITWMDNKSALLNSTGGLIFIVDLQGAVFYLGAEKDACDVPVDTVYSAGNSTVTIWAYPNEIHICSASLSLVIPVVSYVMGVWVSDQFATYMLFDATIWQVDSFTGETTQLPDTIAH